MSYFPSSGSEEDEGVDEYRKGGYHAVRPGDPFGGGRLHCPEEAGVGKLFPPSGSYDTRCEVMMRRAILYLE
ncbi:hypothetical protein HPP92_020302 [Vanilla planifolia]|uniref:Uncharacterized protein n=1 Tax=Vanilla planifolia TaxID=51239 RepID=A0A835PWN0_VANPL|nr:hypothetical protein HPP92_020302 [Vanilla planifolia]